MGFRAGVNAPFAGGHSSSGTAPPRRGIHAIQIEIDRRCYLQHNSVRRNSGFPKVSRLFDGLAMQLGQHLLDRNFREAAE